MRMMRRAAWTAGLLTIAALLAGCAEQLPASPGLGGSDEGGRTPPRGIRVTLDASALPAGTTFSFKRKDANCVRSEYDGAFDPAVGDQFMMEVYNGSLDCTVQSSWATWTLTATLPGGETLGTTYEIAEDLGVGLAHDMPFEAKCWGDGGLGCAAEKLLPKREGNWLVFHFTTRLSKGA